MLLRFEDQEKRLDWRSGKLLALVANVGAPRGKGEPPYKPEDFYPNLRASQVQRVIEATTVGQEEAVAAAWQQWALRAKAVAAKRG